MTENKKARTRYGTESPFTPLLQEEKDKQYERMADEEEELVPTCPPPLESPKEEIHPGNVTMDGIAALLKQQFGPITANINALSAGVQMLDAKYGDLTTAVENRLKEMESRMDVTQAQVAKNGRTSATFKWEERNIPYNVKILEEKPYTMTVEGELALTAHVSPVKWCMNGTELGQIGMNFIQA